MPIVAHIRHFLMAALVAGLFLPAQLACAEPNATPIVETKEQRDQRMAWWREARFGMFIHWGLYAVPAGTWQGKQMPEIGEWVMSKYRIPILEYSKLAERFNPVKFDADQWAQTAKQAGMHYMMITAKHHDGFAMFDSKSDPYNIVAATPFHRDPVAELAAACQKQGLKFGVYYSQALDWHERDAGGTEPGGEPNVGGMSWGNDWDFPDHASKRFDRYFEKKVKPQLRELLTQYGPLAMIWFDCPCTINRAQSEELYQLTRSLQPQCIMNSRLGNGLGDYTSQGDNVIPGQQSTNDWETPATLNDTWGYKSFDQNWKTPETLIRNLIDITSKGGNYLLNVGPTSEGLIPQPSVERLAEVGRWMATNGSAIYGTRGSPFTKLLSWGRCTQKPGKLYLHVFNWPKDELILPALTNRITKAYLLADATQTPLSVTTVANAMRIKLPAEAPDKIASVVVLEIEGTPEIAPQQVTQAADGTIVLPANIADIHGVSARYEGEAGNENIGFWANLNDVVSWEFQVKSPGTFEVEITLACDVSRSGSGYDVSVANQTLSGKVDGTGGWDKYVRLNLGTISLAQAGRHVLSVKPTSMPNNAVMNLRSVVLKPVKP